MGRHQLRLLRFAIRNPQGWHSYGTDRSTVDAIAALLKLELLDHNAITRQFRLALPPVHRSKIDDARSA